MLRDVGEGPSAATGFELPARYEALNSAKDVIFSELLQTYERRRANSPYSIPLTGTGPYPLPFNCLRIVLVVFSPGGDDSIILKENKITEADHGSSYPSTAQSTTGDFSYQIKGEKELLYIEMIPPTESGTLKVYFEQDIPDMLVWNPPTNSGASSLYLPATYNDVVGQEPADAIDDYYNGVLVEVISGTGVGEIGRILDYTGSTRLATMEAAWVAPPTTASLVSMVCPVARPLERAMRRWAAAEILSDNGEDARSHYARARASIESWMEIFDTLTPGHRKFRPYDMEADTYT